VLRSISRSEQRLYWEKFIGSEEVRLVAPFRKATGRHVALPINDAIGRVIERIVRGLFFHAFGSPLPATHEVLKPVLDQFGHRAAELGDTFGIRFPMREACVRQFAYTFHVVEGDRTAGVWIGCFYSRAFALAFFRPRDEQAAPSPSHSR
jgi:hypothetical protein